MACASIFIPPADRLFSQFYDHRVDVYDILEPWNERRELPVCVIELAPGFPDQCRLLEREGVIFRKTAAWMRNIFAGIQTEQGGRHGKDKISDQQGVLSLQ